MRLTNKIMLRIFKKRAFHIPNKRWIRKIVDSLFDIRARRGRGPRRKYARLDGVCISQYDDSLPLRHAKTLHIYIKDNWDYEREKKDREWKRKMRLVHSNPDNISQAKIDKKM